MIRALSFSFSKFDWVNCFLKSEKSKQGSQLIMETKEHRVKKATNVKKVDYIYIYIILKLGQDFDEFSTIIIFHLNVTLEPLDLESFTASL